MGEHAHIEPGGGVRIDLHAWLEHRTAGALPDLTTALHRWTRQQIAAGAPHTNPTALHGQLMLAARSWCGERGYETPEPDLIRHTGSRLDADVWILRARTDGHGPIAVVGIDGLPPTVHSDYCTDPWDWFDADSVTIACPDGHGWIWRTGRELIDSRGCFTTVSVVFGAELDAPFTPCPRCTAHRQDPRTEPCDCDGRPWIICPLCQRRCDIELPSH